MSEKTIYKEDTITDYKTPKMYRVVFLNDDYTTMDFVVEVLMSIFNKNPLEATQIMLDVHQKGKGIVGTYTYDIAKTKIAQVEQVSKKRDFPLVSIMEPEY
ncbi:ATP-dependent Clp protease adaptor ClpS [Herbivorax sp. ANBcel31]|uniref:ATP-dependent Clp protease adaptor ClpS n=1 Tax=Herbivorax sp. ANBcel31 TaxID=3069754 RepID=UPI0027B7072E|nr:ATP-dependent Clp protease adaptor ClpS [Herbivorax sp. ANBcel31]MDQ2087337.1 ATP-dependent Clp protease adaptor ClpS [Herbivorax sp. ANBcel31]